MGVNDFTSSHHVPNHTLCKNQKSFESTYDEHSLIFATSSAFSKREEILSQAVTSSRQKVDNGGWKLIQGLVQGLGAKMLAYSSFRQYPVRLRSVYLRLTNMTACDKTSTPLLSYLHIGSDPILEAAKALGPGNEFLQYQNVTHHWAGLLPAFFLPFWFCPSVPCTKPTTV